MVRKNSLIGLSIAASLFGPTTATASDWGCEVLLCLSDPRGPTTENACVPPISKLWKHLAKGRAFPTCDLAGDSSSGTGSFARQVYDYYDPCPDGTKPAIRQWIAQSSEPVASRRPWGNRPPYSWSDGGNSYGDSGPGARACVAKPNGSFSVSTGDDYLYVQVYETVVWQAPQKPRAIDVYIDGVLHQRVRW